MALTADTLVVTGTATFNGNPSTLTDGQLTLRGDFAQGGASQSFAASGNHRTVFDGAGPQNITFSSPSFTSSRFQDVAFDNLSASGVTLGTAVFAAGNFISTADSLAIKARIIGGGNRLTARALNVRDARLERVLLQWNSLVATGFTAFTNVELASYLDSDTQIDVIHPGGAGAFSFFNITFLTTPVTGLYVQAEDNVVDANTLTLDISSTPSNCVENFEKQVGGALINWTNC
jgi:hypothetical protein